ncbi:flagellar hook protein FlgE [Piscinibacter sakaiensis]|uniref:Flagellar hook protein FlgE n=1 Tax=Piscinibacter sakaiensis TaxID=1547922 RepID=A0A0K8NTR5_PISS1|nr:flagellar hook protein FlgE [Piscinibacter sakaiensis]GAP33753.1 flagellar hook protein FlgE [Piscinibacter sakaiensis]
MGFQQGLSGLNVTAKNLEVIGHNIANANTYGNKASRAEFSDMYANAMNGAGANNIGIGVTLAAVAQQFTQGNITATESPLDLAVNGSGFFQVTDGKSPNTYTRNGQFKIDKDGFIVNNQQLKLMGYPADGQGVIQPGLAKPLQLPTGGIAPAATTEIAMEVNLDSRAKSTEQAAGAAAIDFTDPKTYNNATSVTVYDAKGQDVALTYYFQKATVTTDTTTTPPTTTGADLWRVYVTANGQPLAGTSALPEPSLTVQFDPNGGSPTFTPAPVAPATNPTLDIPASVNGAGAPTLAISGVEMDFSRMTQYGANFGVTDLKQDGYAPGQLSGVTIEDNGVIMARYSNGQSKPAGQIEIANFRNVQGLLPMGGNGWQRSFASGDPIVGVPGDGNLGLLRAGALEESNVDLTGELVNMITAQRIYQANAQTIKAEDQLLQTIVNLR